ncbi:hypothetical protein KEJ18_07105 [Candidatus Bathyarchaeota archaeon]|nr:hypothetical protein [Candidatus Bathyarchaeota archaeon]
MFGVIEFSAVRREPIKFAWYKTWNYVHETLRDPRECQPGQYSTFVISKPKGVLAKICCPVGTYMHTTPVGRRGCYSDPVGGKIVAKPMVQVLLHDVEKFKFRHPVVWKLLVKQPEKRVSAVTGKGWYVVKELRKEQLPPEYRILVA